MLVTKVLQNSWTDFYEIVCAYGVGLRIGQHLLFIPLNDKVDQSLNSFLMAEQCLLGQHRL